MARLKEQYQNEFVDALMKKFGYKNVMQVPKLDKIVITTEPIYLAQYTAAPQIITYQRRFMNAVNNTADKR